MTGHTRIRAWWSAAALAVAAAACGGGSASGDQTSGCASGAQLARLPHGPALTGDLDGDGRVDRAYIALDRHAPARCRYALVVRTATETVGAPVQHTSVAPTADALVALGPKPSAQILVRVQQGASVSGGTLFTYRRGRLRAVPLVGWKLGTLLEWNGGATFLDGVDCLGGRRSGRVLQVTGGEVGSSGTRWSVRKDVFALRADRLVHVSSSASTFHGTNAKLVRRLPAAEGRAFAGCRIAR